MKRLLILALAASASAPALAQHEGHGAPAPDPHAGHAPPQRQPQPDPHAGHHMEETPQAQDPHEGHEPQRPQGPAAQDDPHAGHHMDEAQQAEDPHAGHRMEAPEPPAGPPPPAALSGPRHAADEIFGGQMVEAREDVRRLHGALSFHKFSIDQLEVSFRRGREGYAWEDVQFWYGNDLDKLWIKSEGEGTFGEGLERGEVQALWSHAIGPWFDLQAGARLEFGHGPERPSLVLGILGLAPYWFEIDAAVFLSSKGDLTARFEGEHDVRLTQRLILQPRVEADFSLQDIPELRTGSGLSSAEAGLRLRYEIVPEFAPYVGVQYERAFGDTARFLRATGDDPGGWSLILGMRAWF